MHFLQVCRNAVHNTLYCVADFIRQAEAHALRSYSSSSKDPAPWPAASMHGQLRDFPWRLQIT
jgi:hypothetical protein